MPSKEMPAEEQGIGDYTESTADELDAKAKAGDYDQRVWPTLESGPQGLTDEQLEVLMSPLKASRVAHRTQGGATLSYLEAWEVKASLIRVFGFGGFDARTIKADVIRVDYDESKKQYTVVAQATVELTIHDLDCTYTEASVAGQAGPRVGDVADFALKTAESDALKRCATYLGTQFGLGLYDNGSLNEVVRAVYEPHQKAQLERIRSGQPDPREHADGNLGRALGATREGQS